MNKRVLLGMSGGVDSSVAAYLLKKEGYEVVGLHFTLRGEKGNLKDLDAVCAHLQIPYEVADFSKVFDEKVFAPFIKAYERGETPNICVECNRYIKFGALKEEADRLNCSFLATGHFCDVEKKNGQNYLKRSKDDKKDQTYFLSLISQDVLSRVLFPLSGLTKEEVRAIAREAGIPVAEKKDSSDVCLSEGRTFKDFLADHIPPSPGKIISDRGEVVGSHSGLHTVTLGQRKGLNLGGKSGEDGRWFVVDKDGGTNSVVVSHGSEELLFAKAFEMDEVNFINGAPKTPFQCLVKTRYRATEKSAVVFFEDGIWTVSLDERERAITKGQYAVMYLDGICLGGGKIKRVIKN